MTLFLLLAAAIIIICVLLNKASSKLGMPMLLAFIALGMVFGSDGLVKIDFDDYRLAEQVCTVALIFIMFYGGFGTKWSAAKPVAVRAGLLATVGVFLTAVLMGLFCYFVLGIQLLEALLIGAVLSSTDAASVFSILRSRRLDLKDNTASLLEMESGSNDPCSYMLTVIVLSMINGALSAGQVAYMIFAQLAYGAAGGVLIALGALFMLRRFKFSTAGFDAVFVVAVAVLAYAVPSIVGGNGYLSAYIVGIILGNQKFANKRNLVHFFDGMTGLMQMLIFFLLGLLAFPSRMPGVWLTGLLLALFLTFIARPLAVFAIMAPFRSSIRQQLLVSWAGLRGAASIVFAIMAISNTQTVNDVFHIVFFIVLFSIALQGSLLPLMAKKLKMLDKEANVMKTFTDYSEEEPVQYLQLNIQEGHPWQGQTLRQLALPPDMLIVLLLRDGRRLIPRGDTQLQAGDTLALSGPSYSDNEDLNFAELRISAGHEYLGKTVAAIDRDHAALIIMIKRGPRVVIPHGDTVVEQDDVLIISGE